jgi:hypothetical protein
MHERSLNFGGAKLKISKRTGAVLAAIAVILVYLMLKGYFLQLAPEAATITEELHPQAVDRPTNVLQATTENTATSGAQLFSPASAPAQTPQTKQALSNSAWANPRGLGAAMDEARTTRSPVNALAAARAAEQCAGMGHALEREIAANALPKSMEGRRVQADAAKELQRKAALCTAISDNSPASRKELILIALEGGVAGSAIEYLKLDGVGNPKVFAAAYADAKNGDLEAIFSLLVRSTNATGLAQQEYQTLALALKQAAAEPATNELAVGFMNAAIELDQKNLKSRLPGGAFLEAVSKSAPSDVQTQAAQIAALIRQRRG